MSDTVIRVENLSKKYLLDQQREGRSNYKSIKESLPNAISSLRKKILHPQSDKGFKPSQEEFWALKDVSFEIKQGDRVGIIGRNGAGKSTLLKVLSRITEPTNGKIGINGRIASLLEVGTGFHPELTGRENIFLNGAILGMSQVEIKRKFDEIVDFAEVEKFLYTPVKRYSSGMYVRLAFSVAAHMEPEILIVDEVLAVGDASFQKKCMRKMSEVAREGRTILFVSHNVEAMNTLCSEAVYLVKGQVKDAGRAEDIIKNYMSDLFESSENDLSSLRRQGYGKTTKFTDIQLLAEDSQDIHFGEKIKCSLTLHSEENVNSLSIGCSIFNTEGNCVGTLLTKENFSIGAHQSITLHLTVPNFNLAPGSYYAGFSVGQGKLGELNRFNFDIVVGQPAFQVISLLNNNDRIAQWPSDWGNIVIKDSCLVVAKQDFSLASK
jgi:lipopolysaccharide transport system ATP-binding protein